MSSKLNELREQHDKLLLEAKLIEDQLQEEQIKELQRETSPIRYDSETGVFTIKIPAPESNSGYTEVELALSEDHFDNLYQEISTEKVKALLDDLTPLTGLTEGGWKRSPPTHFPDTFTKFSAKFDTSNPLGAALNDIFGRLKAS